MATREDGALAEPKPVDIVQARSWRAERSTILATPRFAITRCHSMRAAVEGMFATHKLDAIAHATASRRWGDCRRRALPRESRCHPACAMGLPATNIANLTGFPDLVMPAGFTGDRTTGWSFISRAGLQRGQAAGDRLQLRAGHARPALAGAHAAAVRRGDQHAVKLVWWVWWVW